MSSNIFMKKYLNASNSTVLLRELKLHLDAVNIDSLNTVDHGIFALRRQVLVHNSITVSNVLTG
jgi:hypothetical protein